MAMLQLLKLLTLLVALLIIPWMAANPPPWRLLNDSGWVQAWGSIAAIFVGFAYVALQHTWERSRRHQDQAETRRYLVSLMATGLIDMDNTQTIFAQAAKQEMAVMPMLGRDTQDVIADELLTAIPSSCGSAAFAIKIKAAAFYAKSFAHTCHIIARPIDGERAPPSQDALDSLASARATFGARHQELLKML